MIASVWAPPWKVDGSSHCFAIVKVTTRCRWKPRVCDICEGCWYWTWVKSDKLMGMPTMALSSVKRTWSSKLSGIRWNLKSPIDIGLDEIIACLFLVSFLCTRDTVFKSISFISQEHGRHSKSSNLSSSVQQVSLFSFVRPICWLHIGHRVGHDRITGDSRLF